MEENDTPQEDATAETQPDPAPQGEETDWKSEARKWESRAKQNKEAAERLKELEDSKKSEQEKLTERLSDLESTAKSSTLEAARLRVALRKGLTETQAKRLVGDTVEELEADAEELLASFQTDEPSDSPRRPKERLRAGAAPDAEPQQSSEELVEAVIKQRGF